MQAAVLCVLLGSLGLAQVGFLFAIVVVQGWQVLIFVCCLRVLIGIFCFVSLQTDTTRRHSLLAML